MSMLRRPDSVAHAARPPPLGVTNMTEIAENLLGRLNTGVCDAELPEQYEQLSGSAQVLQPRLKVSFDL